MIKAKEEERHERGQSTVHQASELEGQKGTAVVEGDPGMRKAQPTWE